MILRAENIVKKYKSRTVVKGVSFEVKQGEIVGLLGPNGAGKTTSFYMTVGLIKPNSGSVFLIYSFFIFNFLYTCNEMCYKYNTV